MSQVTAKDLSALLARDAEGVARYLLGSEGKREGHELRYGDVTGAPGKSLGVHLTGDKAGVWKDFSSGEGGDLLDLWAESKGIGLGDAIREAKEYLGIRDVPLAGKQPVARPIDRPKGVTGLRESELRWLTDARKLSRDAVAAYKLVSKGAGVVAFPYLLPSGELVGMKYRATDQDKYWAEAGGSKVLFGWQAIPATARSVVLCEGELKALAWWGYGFPALSVPFGGGDGGKQDWIEVEYDRLAQFDVIYVAMDEDAAGRAAADAIIERLGVERCAIVEHPLPNDPKAKCINSCVSLGVDQASVAASIKCAKPRDPEELRDASAYTDDVVSLFTDRGPEIGIRTPWQKVGDALVFRPGELTVIAGINGHGKALCLDTPIPTPDGWKRMGDIVPGDRVFDEHGAACNVVWESPVQLDRPCYRVVFSDGAEIIADAEHEWVTETAKGRQYRKQAEKVTTSQIAETLHGSGCRSCLANHSIRVAGSLQAQDAELPIDPYVLGAWLGDGTSSDSGLTCDDPEIVEAIEAAGFPCVKSTARLRYGIRGGLFRLLRVNGLLGNKHVPAPYLRASDRQRLELLRGLMDTDGHVTPYGRCEFTSMKAQLADSVRELVLSLGWQAQVIQGEATIDGRACGTKYRVTFTPDRDVFKIQRKSARIAKSITDRAKRRYIVACDPVESVPVKCIEVDSESHLYLASKSMIPTHNSQAVGFMAAHAMRWGARVCVASLEFKVKGWLHRLVRQIASRPDPSGAYVQRIMSWLGERLWAFDAQGTADWARMIEVFRYARRRYGVELFVIDNLTGLGIGEEDYQGQKSVTLALSNFARDEGCHVWLVHHIRKSGSEHEQPDKMDIKGSGAITDLASTVLTVWRNKAKEAKRLAAKDINAPLDPEVEGQPDVRIRCSKQRNYAGDGNGEPSIALWWDGAAYHYLARPDHRPRPILPVDFGGEA